MRDIKGFTLEELSEFCRQNDFAGFRSQQIFNWLYQNLTADPESMQNLPEELQYWLRKNFNFTNLKEEKLTEAKDGTINIVYRLEDDKTIETVLLPQTKGSKFTACLSTQVGCSLGCKFCATGQQGYVRDLKAAEIVDQVWQGEKLLSAQENLVDARNGISGTRNIRNIVFMGMGEPLLNYNQLLKAVNILRAPATFDIGSRRITISTVGIIPGIKKMAQDMPQVGLAISLHAADNKLRNKLIPLNKKYGLRELKAVLKDHQEITGRRVTIEYALIKGVNDSQQQAKKLARWLKGLKAFINLIPLNPIEGSDLSGSNLTTINSFKAELIKSGYSVKIRDSKGQEIKAACGQLKQQEEAE